MMSVKWTSSVSENVPYQAPPNPSWNTGFTPCPILPLPKPLPFAPEILTVLTKETTK